MSKILIVVDMQNDFIDGALGSPEALAIGPYVKSLIDLTNSCLNIFSAMNFKISNCFHNASSVIQ